MLLIKSEIKEKTGGICLIASKFISKGTKVWSFNENVDFKFSKEEFENMIKTLSEDNEKRLRNYVVVYDDNYILRGDNARFISCSSYPNIIRNQNNDFIACRDIYIDEEIVEKYEKKE